MDKNNSVNENPELASVSTERADEASDLVAGEAMTIEENLRMIEAWLRPLRPGEEPFMRERAIAIHVRFIREALVPLEAVAEAAKALIWEPENWEAYTDSKDSISVAWPPEFLLLAQAVEALYGPMPMDLDHFDPCIVAGRHVCGPKTQDTNAGASPGTTDQGSS